MDPTATLIRFLLASTLVDAIDAACDLSRWLASGGFEPDWTPSQRDRFERFCEANGPLWTGFQNHPIG